MSPASTTEGFDRATPNAPSANPRVLSYQDDSYEVAIVVAQPRG